MKQKKERSRYDDPKSLGQSIPRCNLLKHETIITIGLPSKGRLKEKPNLFENLGFKILNSKRRNYFNSACKEIMG